MAARLGSTIQIKTRWGPMDGRAGDYLVKSYEAKDERHPEVVWIVARSVFDKSYVRVPASQSRR